MDNDIQIPTSVTTNIEHVNSSFETMMNDNSSSIPRSVEQLQHVLHDDLLPLINCFREEGCAVSPAFKLWDNFLFDVLLPLIRATRGGEWNIYQDAKTHLLPFLFISNRTTYAKYMSVLQLQMKRLPADVLAAFKEGLFIANFYGY